MTTDRPEPGSRIPNLLRFEWGLVVAVIVGAFGVGSLGLLASYDTVGQAAENWGFHPPWILPVAIDVAIPVFSLARLLLIRADMPMTGVREVPWALTGVTVYLNVSAVPGDQLAPKLGHGALPLLWVVCSEIAAHVYKAIIGAATGRRMERVRRSRWFLSPVPTFLLWRRMILWEVTSYRDALGLERRRVLARADLRERYGWRWRTKTPRREKTLLKLGELEPVTEVPTLVAVGTGTGTGTLLDSEPGSRGSEPVTIVVQAAEPEPEPGLQVRNLLDLGGPTEPEVPNPRSERSGRHARAFGTANLGARAAKKKAQVSEVLELLEQFGTDVVDLKFVTDNTGIPRTTAYHRLNEARDEWDRNRNEAAVPNRDAVPIAAGPFNLELGPDSEQRTGT